MIMAVPLYGLNGDLLSDGGGNPKHTKSLVLAHETLPAVSVGTLKVSGQPAGGMHPHFAGGFSQFWKDRSFVMRLASCS